MGTKPTPHAVKSAHLPTHKQFTRSENRYKDIPETNDISSSRCFFPPSAAKTQCRRIACQFQHKDGHIFTALAGKSAQSQLKPQCEPAHLGSKAKKNHGPCGKKARCGFMKMCYFIEFQIHYRSSQVIYRRSTHPPTKLSPVIL